MDRPLRRFNREGERFIRRSEEEQDSIARIAQAKRTAERAGYEVELARPRLERPFRRPVAEEKPRQATVVQDAIKTARDAGYEVSRMSRLQQAAQVARDAGYTIKRGQEEPVEKPVEATPETNYVNRAARFLARNED